MNVHYTSCPLCAAEGFFPLITCVDHVVSNERFNVVQCENCGFKFTQDVPDQADIGAYYKSKDYVWRTRKKRGTLNRIYHIVKNISLEGKYKLVNSLTQGNYIVDYGCSGGEFLGMCKNQGWNVLGIEINPEARALAKQNNITALPPESLSTIADATIDLVTMWHVLEHVHSLKEVLQNLKRILKPGGKLVIAAPNCTSQDAIYYKSFWAAYDVPRHLYHFEPKTMRLLLTEMGLKQHSVHPLLFDAYYICLLSEKHKNQGKLGIGGLIRGLYHGLSSNLNADEKNLAHSSLIYIFEKTKN